MTTANVVAARFDHIAARPSENAANDGYGPDPHLHTHVVVMNMTRRPDGAWRGLDPVEIYRSQAFATAVYRAELARQVQKLGYAISVTGRDGRWELEGCSREQVMAFSQRRQDIEQELARLGVNGAGAAQIAAHRSRLAKDYRDQEALKVEWRQRADAYDIKVDVIAAKALNLGSLWRQSDAPTLTENVRVTIAHTTERDAVPDRRELETFALQHTMGRSILEHVRGAVERHRDDGKLIAIAPSHRHPIGSFTTPVMAALEGDNIVLMRESQSKASAISDAEKIRRWAVRRRLAPDQTAAAEVTLSTRDWLSAIDGRAGAAKTTTVGAIRELAQEEGYFVRGFGPTSGSVKALTEAGVLSRTVASLLENPPPEKHGREFWIVDESSLLATRQVNLLLHLAKDAGVERIVFVGDQRQHHAIEAGRPVYQMQHAGMTIASLNVIRRQRDPELRRAVELASAGKAGEVIEALTQQDRITQIAPAVDRYRAIAEDYLRSYQAEQRTVVVSPANEERRELNRTIRELLVERGQVGRDGFELPILTSLDLTRAQRAHARHYAEGDVIRFRRGSLKLGIERGSYATVEASDLRHDRLTIRTSAGAAIEYAPQRLRGVEVFRPESRTLSVGDRIQFRTPTVRSKSPTASSQPSERSMTNRSDSGWTTAVRSARPRRGSGISTTATPRLRIQARARPSIASSSMSIPRAASSWSINASFMSRSAERGMTRGFTRTTQLRWLARLGASSSSQPRLNICRPRSGRIPGITRRSRSTTRPPRGSSRAYVRNKSSTGAEKSDGEVSSYAGPRCQRTNGAPGRRGVSVMNFCTRCGSRLVDRESCLRCGARRYSAWRSAPTEEHPPEEISRHSSSDTPSGLF